MLNASRTSRIAVLSIIAAGFLSLIGCGSSTTSPLVQSLEAISIAADVGAPVVAAISPQAAAWVSLVPGVVSAALDVAEGKTAFATASTVIVQLQAVWTQGQALLPNLTGTDKTVISGILGAIKAGIDLYSQQYPPAVASSVVHTAYVMGFTAGPSASTAKVKKLSKSDKAAIARARAHVAALKSALTLKK
jgi:hypothetical protein